MQATRELVDRLVGTGLLYRDKVTDPQTGQPVNCLRINSTRYVGTLMRSEMSSSRCPVVPSFPDCAAHPPPPQEKDRVQDSLSPALTCLCPSIS